MSGSSASPDIVAQLVETIRTLAGAPAPGRAGTAEVTRISLTSAADERRLVFDPTNITDGFALSADPIPLARSSRVITDL